jgi:hypothetical protein
MKYIVTNLFISLLFAASAYSQNTQWTDPGYDTSYVESFRDYLVVTAIAASSSNELRITDRQGEKLNYSTNLPTSFGVAIDYKWLTLEYTSSFGASQNLRGGYSDLTSIGFGLTTRKLWFRNFYRRTQGYFIQNPEYFDPDFDPNVDPYPNRPDMRTSVYYASLNYGFNNRKFSNMAALWQLERQKKSAGSFTVGLTFSLADFTADSLLVPAAFIDNFEPADLSVNLDFLLAGINAGYLHTFVFGRSSDFFVSVAVVPGLSYQRAIARAQGSVNENQLSKNTAGIHGEGRVVLGYNGNRWYASLSSVGYAISSNFSDVNPFSQGYTFSRIMVGYKFKMKETQSPFLKRIGM